MEDTPRFQGKRSSSTGGNIRVTLTSEEYSVVQLLAAIGPDKAQILSQRQQRQLLSIIAKLGPEYFDFTHSTTVYRAGNSGIAASLPPLKVDLVIRHVENGTIIVNG